MGNDVHKDDQMKHRDLSNDALKKAFQHFQEQVVNTMNTATVIDRLFAHQVLTADDLCQLDSVEHRPDKARRLLIILHRSTNDDAFILLRLSMKQDSGCDWVIKAIDKKYREISGSKDGATLNRDTTNSPTGGMTSLALKNSCVKVKEAQLQTALLSTTNEARMVCCSPDGDAISGLATLGCELYIARYQALDIEVLNAETLTPVRRQAVCGLYAVNDMAACCRQRCVYISDHGNNVVHRIDAVSAVVTQWPVNDMPAGMSVNSLTNVLVTCCQAGKVKEFTTHGHIIRVISLPSDVIQPAHAVELAVSSQLAICHGRKSDPVHRVCLIEIDSTDSRMLQSYGDKKGSEPNGQLHTPARLAVSGFLLVADVGNGRIVLLGPTLGFVRVVVTGLTKPFRMWLDQDSGRLYVADNQWQNDSWVSGQVKVFSAT